MTIHLPKDTQEIFKEVWESEELKEAMKDYKPGGIEFAITDWLEQSAKIPTLLEYINGE
jgi:hypothetical protein